MHVVMGAQSCGFGPVSKLTAAARSLTSHRRTFVGDTVAVDFAKSNTDVFDAIHDSGAGAIDYVDTLASADWVISVMDAELVLRAVAARRPVTMIDSLFSFWQLDVPAERIAELCATAPRQSYAALDEHFRTLSPHERIFAAHLLADHSVLQNFPGVHARAELARELSGTGFHVTGSIVDGDGLAEVRRGDEPEYDLLVNVGGFKNFLLDFEQNNQYLVLLDRWIADLLADWPTFDRVLVCGGAFTGSRQHETTVSGRTADFRFRPQRQFLQEVGVTPYYMMTPGLTALHEAMALDQLPMALPEQHYGHVVNLRQVGGTVFGRLGMTLNVGDEPYPLIEDDFKGTQSIVTQAGRLLADDDLYRAFRRSMNGHVEQFVGVTPTERARGVGELREMLDGVPVGTVLASIAEQLEPVDRAGPVVR